MNRRASMLHVVLVLGCTFAGGAEGKGNRLFADPVDWVDPLINSSYGRIFQTKTVSRPFGLVQAAPDTVIGRGFWGGYSYNTANVKGFSHVRDWRIAGLLVMPTLGGVAPAGPDFWNSDFSHESEVAQAGYHKVVLDRYGITAEMTSTMRVAMHRWMFAEGGHADIMFDMLSILKEAHPFDCSVRKVNNSEIEGWAHMRPGGKWGQGKGYKLFFVAQFDRPMLAFRGWKEKDLGVVDEISGFPAVAYPRFRVSAGDVMQMKLAVSYCSVEQARTNVVMELDHWDFSRVRQESRHEWNDMLKRVEVEGGTDDQKRKFYTDLWHVLLGRSTYSDANGRYPDRIDKEEAVIRELPRNNVPSSAEDSFSPEPEFRMFNSDSLWWSMWSINVLWGMAYPEVLEEWVRSSLQFYEDDPKHRIPWGVIAGEHSWIMSGAQRTPLIARAIQMNMKNIDQVKAYKALLDMHLGAPFKEPFGNVQWGDVYEEYGYVPAESVSFSASQTLEHSWCDWVLAQVCDKMGDTENYKYFLKRSENWKNIWNPEMGYLMPRKKDGSWVLPFDPFHPSKSGQRGYIEGCGGNYLWFAVHDVMGLCNLMGGPENYCERLNQAFEISLPHRFAKIHGHVDYGNNMDCQLAHLFSYAGKPWLTQYWVRQVNEKTFGHMSYSEGLRGGGRAADEDQGLMGGVSALMSMGLFSIRGCSAVDPIYEITTPVFDEVTIHLDPEYYTGQKFVIATESNSTENCYIQSARLNGRLLDRCWFYHRDFAKGGRLDLTLGPEPNEAWGSELSQLPPSASRFAPVNTVPKPVKPKSIRINIASTAKVSASSVFNKESFGAERAVDGAPAEWSSKGERRPWIRLEWDEPVSITSVVLRDRPNKHDHTISGTLTFSDGGSIAVTDMQNDGSPKVIDFLRREVKWLKFEVTESKGFNIGLEEIEVRAETGANPVKVARRIKKKALEAGALRPVTKLAPEKLGQGRPDIVLNHAGPHGAE